MNNNINKHVLVVEENDTLPLGHEFVVDYESDAHFMSQYNNASERYLIIINKGYCAIKDE